MFYERNCALCGARESYLCEKCQAGLKSNNYQMNLAGFPLHFSFYLENEVKRLLLKMKNENRTSLRKYFAIFTAELLATQNISSLMPVPSNLNNHKRRGNDHLKCYLKEVKLKSKSKIEILDNIMQMNPRISDQRGLSERARMENMSQPMAFKKTGKLKTNPISEIWLFDDVVTTGSTLIATKAALAKEGIMVKGAVAIAKSRFLAQINGNSR
jgi:predicted amidophosphoribosyltransferase